MNSYQNNYKKDEREGYGEFIDKQNGTDYKGLWQNNKKVVHFSELF